MSDKKYFTLEAANRSIPYISRIVRDIQTAYLNAVKLQDQLDGKADGNEEYQKMIGDLNRYVDELTVVGVDIRDYELGTVGFLSNFDGRDIFLCWKLGEDKISSWYDVNSGFANRKDVAQLVG
jgi:hypothetical protein